MALSWQKKIDLVATRFGVSRRYARGLLYAARREGRLTEASLYFGDSRVSEIVAALREG